MDRNGNKKVGVVRTRLPSNNSTPNCSSSRGTSTPTGSISKNRSCNFSPITNPDNNKTTVTTERLEPKLLKTLGPSFPQSVEKKNSQLKTKSAEDQATLLYMAYQQQQFLNNSLSNVKEKIQNESQKQTEELWALVKARESEVEEIRERSRLVRNHSELNSLVNYLEPTLKSSTDIVKSVIPLAKELAQGLDTVRHQIRLDGINRFKKEDLKEIQELIERGERITQDVNVNGLDDIMKVANSISDLTLSTSSQIKIMEECQQLSSMTITRLGQELTLAEGENEFKKLKNLDL